MFDVATRPQPASAAAARLIGVPFDWRLVEPGPQAVYPWRDFVQPSGVPVVYADVLAAYSLDLEDTLQTAVIISLFTDRRATDDDALPLNETDRRGWLGDELLASGGFEGGEEWGSHLWLCYFTKVGVDVLERARFAAQEALAWMVRDGIASRIDVAAQWVGANGDRLAVRPTIYQEGSARPVYDVLWGTSITRLAQ